jgi:L-cysteine desulfidase
MEVKKMPLAKETMDVYSEILNTELKDAMGCTEPIAIAYCAAYAVRLLGKRAERYVIGCSGNIIKNVKAVTVPETGGRRGIEVAVLAGAVSGRADLELQVLSVLTDEDRAEIGRLLEKKLVTVRHLDSPHPLHIILDCYAGKDSVSVEILDTHTGLGRITKNGATISTVGADHHIKKMDAYELLNVKDILIYARTADLEPVRAALERQIEHNTAISVEGLSREWGMGIGKTLLTKQTTLSARIKAVAAAGSDARMNGCPLPVVIVCGSGNQGIAASVPVIEYAKSIEASHNELLRALCVSNLCAIHQKAGIGSLSAYCGAVCAATGSAAGIAFLDGCNYQCISDTIINSLANVSGMVCDGAKSSCAAKISSALEGALLGYELARHGRRFLDGEGIVDEDVEQTITNIGRMASRGMKATDDEILDIMING